MENEVLKSNIIEPDVLIMRSLWRGIEIAEARANDTEKVVKREAGGGSKRSREISGIGRGAISTFAQCDDASAHSEYIL
jgi:hypothetical protein